VIQVPKDVPTKYYAPNRDQLKDIWYRDVVGKFGLIPEPYPESFGGSPAAGSGFEFNTLSICVPRYLLWLQNELVARGVKFVKGWVDHIADVEYVPGSTGQLKTDVIVNASGLGAKSIIGIADPQVYPIRGQTALVKAPSVQWCLLGMGLYVSEREESTYIIPRSNGEVVVGGTFQFGNWDVSPDPDIARGILERAVRYCPELATRNPEEAPSISDVQVLRHCVGLRPARMGGARVEKEIIELSKLNKDAWAEIGAAPWVLSGGRSSTNVEQTAGQVVRAPLKVVHAYGMGPAGYQASWGVAADVCKLVDELSADQF